MYGRRDTAALYVLHCCYIPCLYTEQFSVLSSRYKSVSFVRVIHHRMQCARARQCRDQRPLLSGDVIINDYVILRFT